MEYRILGPLEVRREDRQVELGGRKQRALLALLLLHANEVVHAERLIDELWSGEPPESAAKSLQVYVSRLRKQLGDGALRTRAGGYVLEVAEGELDLDRFRATLDRGRRQLAAGDPEAAAETLATALALWCGPPLADFRYDSFAQSEITRLGELRLAAHEERIEAELALGRHADLIGELELLVDDNPLRERFRGQLMLALYRSGRQAEALEAYQDARRALVVELGIDPGRALQTLEQEILNQDPRLDAPVAADAEPETTVRAGRLAAGLFVGRESELAELEAALADARAGRGRLVLLAGEAGIGKSRLADELAGRAKARGVRVLWGRCWEAGGAPAYWPWIQALRTYARDCDPSLLRRHVGHGAAHVAQLLPELRELFPDLTEPPTLDTEADRFRLFDSTAGFLRGIAAEQPLLVVLDDVHAADTSSLLMLEFVAADLADAAVLVLAAYRDPELEPGDPTAAALADVARRASVRIALTGLRPPEVASYIELSADVEPPASLVAAIASETEGNPLFVGEIVRLLAVDGRLDAPADASWRPVIPETVKEVIGRRLNRLSPECIETLALASVLGREFPLDLLERLSGRPAGELLTVLGEAIAARLVTDVPGSPGRMRFTHALVRDTLYDTLAPARRLDVHRRAGEAIEAVAGPDPGARLSELAHHFFQALPAVDPDVAVEYTRRAADQAGVLLAHEEAARLYETALHALGLRSQPDRDVERTLLLRLGESLARSGDMPNARDAFLRAAAIARATGAAEDLAAAAIGYGGRIVWVRPAGDVLVVSLLEEALAALGEEETPLRARLLARLAGALRDERDPAHRREVAVLAVETARRTGDLAALTYALAGLCASEHGIGNEPARLAVTAELAALAHATGDKEAECEALMAQTLMYFDNGAIAAVRERAARLAALADELRQPAHRWFSLAIQAMLAVYEGRLVDAEQLVPSAADVGARAGSQVEGAYALQLYELRHHQGRASEAYELLASFAAKTPARPVFRSALARLSAELERRAEARHLFEELASNGFEVIPRDNEWMLALSYLVDVCRALGDTTRAAVLYDLLAPYVDKTAADVPEGCAGSVARLLGILAVMLERDDAAVEHLEAAIATDVAAGTRPWAAHSQVELAEILARRGTHERAATLRGEAAATAAELGLLQLAERITEMPDR